MITLIQHFEADFPQKVSLKILNSGIILKTYTHELQNMRYGIVMCDAGISETMKSEIKIDVVS